MNSHVRLAIEKFDQELETHRLFAIGNKELLKKYPWFDQQIIFWMESTRFLVAELEIWNERGDETKCAEVISRAQKSLDRLYRLIEQVKKQDDVARSE